MIHRLFRIFGWKKEEENEGDVIYGSLKMLLNDRIASCGDSLEIKPDERGVCINISKEFDEDENAYYYVVDVTTRLGGIMMMTGEYTVEIPIISGNKVVVSSNSVKTSIGIGKNRKDMRFVEIDEGCVQVERINRNYAEIKLIAGKKFCTSYLSDGRSVTVTTPLWPSYPSKSY